jgi:signal transduction histidine kinase/ActR/RegA family two-component response regulator
VGEGERVSESDAGARDCRLLALVPTSKDASLTQALMSSHGIPIAICPTFDALIEELRAGAAAILLPEEALSAAHNAILCDLLAEQPPWSDLPVLVLTRRGANSDELDEAVRLLGNLTLLERPLRAATLLSAVRTAARARDRQYQIRGHLADRARVEESLRIADQRKDEFLATLGHELRNPLAPLRTGLHLLKRAGLQDPVVVKMTAVMERQVSHLIRLVDDLLEVSRITRGVIDVHSEPLDLASIVRAAIDTSRPLLDAGRHALTVDVPAEPIAIMGDAVRLTQVFANLLTNAAKYTNAGGHIGLAVRKEGQRAIISVRDDGIGIPPAQLATVFEMFTQVDRSSRRTQGGLGIGLTLVRSLVGIHGGRVEARSAGANAGSEFIVDLPILVGRPVDADRTEALEPFPPRRILVVDDNADAAETLGALLAGLGATVLVVNSGPAALEVLDTFNPDTVLLDLGMPEMDGYEVSRRIRATTDHEGVLLIALTGWGQEHDQRRSHAAGFDHHLVKPPDIGRLRDLLMADWNPVRETWRSA